MRTDVTESAIRRFIKEVGDDIINDLIEFGKCDITTRFDHKRLKYQKELDIIKEKCFSVIKKDKESEWKNPLTGEIIMEILNVKPGRIIGEIKKKYEMLLKENKMSLDNVIEEIKNNYELERRNNK